MKTADGVTRGSYSYFDANGLLQTVNYISDAMGFRVAATNLTVHHVEAPVAKAADAPPVAVVADATSSVVAEAAPTVPAAADPEVVAVYTNNVIPPQVQYA